MNLSGNVPKVKKINLKNEWVIRRIILQPAYNKEKRFTIGALDIKNKIKAGKIENFV